MRPEPSALDQPPKTWHRGDRCHVLGFGDDVYEIVEVRPWTPDVTIRCVSEQRLGTSTIPMRLLIEMRAA